MSDPEIQFNIQDNFSQESLPSTSSVSTPISAMVDPKLKQKIWQDQYIDLALLLPQNCLPGSNRSGLQFKVASNSTLALQQVKPKFVIFTIEQWTTAFLRYIAIYSERFPDATPHLIKHA